MMGRSQHAPLHNCLPIIRVSHAVKKKRGKRLPHLSPRFSMSIVCSLFTATSPVCQNLNTESPAHDFFESQNEEEVVFPSLPVLHRGHPEVHLRNGVMEADRLLALGEPDAERAFFVADLSQVYRQHERWRKNLPGILPFYGWYHFFSSHLNDQHGDVIYIFFFNGCASREV